MFDIVLYKTRHRAVATVSSSSSSRRVRTKRMMLTQWIVRSVLRLHQLHGRRARELEYDASGRFVVQYVTYSSIMLDIVFYKTRHRTVATVSSSSSSRHLRTKRMMRMHWTVRSVLRLHQLHGHRAGKLEYDASDDYEFE